jgi:monoamine oxidase
MAQKHCVVIGAGLAGLAAAYELTLRHWKVTVLEASDRLGGRVLSHTFDQAPHLVCELGGEWVGRDHKEMHRLCRIFRLKLIRHQYCNSFMPRGKNKREKIYQPKDWCLSSDAKKRFKRFAEEFKKMKDMERRQLDKLDWWTRLEMLGFKQEDLLRRDLMDSTDFGESIRHASAYVAAAEYISADGLTVDDTDEMDKKIAGGNIGLINKLACAVGCGNIRREYVVRHIKYNKRGVKVWADNKTPIEADACICAIPAHYLRKITWYPRPQKLIEASEQLQYARITKTVVLCRKRFWKLPPRFKGGYSVFTDLASDFCFDASHGQKGTHGILCSYAIGEKADDIDCADEYELGEWIVGDVAKAVYGRREIETPLAVKRQSWRKDEYTGGAYAFYRPGQWFGLREALAQPLGCVHFAGEHLSDDWQGFMEGAVETGLAAAKQL